VERALVKVSREHEQARQRLQRVQQRSKQAAAQTLAYGRALVRKTRAGLLPVGGGFQALVDHATALERLRRTVARGLAHQRSLEQRRAEIGHELETLRDRRAQLEAQRQALSQASTALAAAQDRALAFERAFSSSGPSSHTAVYGAGVGPADPAELAAGFTAMKGRLPFPLPGRTEVLPARRPGSDGPGLEMHAPTGSPVRAVYSGRVAFADEYAAYGKTVIIDHGDRYYTVTGNLQELGVSAGEDLAAGARIGTVGGIGRAAGIYFEIRHGVATIEPGEWFGI
jgi:septal ring factor EnvC (AmiA/AmiB activator)